MKRMQGALVGGTPIKISFAKVTSSAQTVGGTRTMAQPFGQGPSHHNVRTQFCDFGGLPPHPSLSFRLLRQCSKALVDFKGPEACPSRQWPRT